MYDVEQFEEMSKTLANQNARVSLFKGILEMQLKCNSKIARLLFMEVLRTGAAIAAESSEMCGLSL